MNTIDVSVKIRNTNEQITLVLFQKIYSTPIGIVNHWSTNQNSEHRLEVIIDDYDLSINPSKVIKSMSIITEELEIADQVMLKLYEKGSFEIHKLINQINNN